MGGLLNFKESSAVTQAAIRAGYAAKTAQEQSSRLLSNVIVADAVSINLAAQFIALPVEAQQEAIAAIAEQHDVHHHARACEGRNLGLPQIEGVRRHARACEEEEFSQCNYASAHRHASGLRDDPDLDHVHHHASCLRGQTTLRFRPFREPQFGLALLIGRLKAVPKWGRENLTKPDIASTGAGVVTWEF